MPTDRRRTLLLALGSALSGLLAYVFFVLVTRVLGPVQAAPVSVLWTLWSFGGAALTFPIQHWTTSTVLGRGGERAVVGVLGRVVAGSVGLAVVAGVAGWLVRDALFAGEAWFALEIAGVVFGSAAMGVARGVLGARRRYAAMGALLVAENGLRCVAVVLLALVGVSDPAAYGAALLVGYLAMACWPSAFRLVGGATGRSGDAGAALPGAAGGQILSQTVLTGTPLLLAAAGGAPAQVTALFATLALWRAPYTLSLGVLAPVTVRLTQAVVQGHRLRGVRIALVAVVVGGAALAAGVGHLAGPAIVRAVFGADVELAAAPSAAVAAASVVAIGNLVVTALVFAQGRAGGLVAVWAIALVPGLLWWWLGPGPAVDRATGTFLVAELAAFAGLMLWSGSADRGDGEDRGAGREVDPAA